MTTDPIAAARALIAANSLPAENVGHGHVFPRPDGVRARCGGPKMCKECAADLARKPDPWSALATLADALEAKRAEAEKWREAAGAHHVAAMKEAEKWIAVSAERDGLREELAKTLIQTGDLKIALAGAQAQVAAAYEAAAIIGNDVLGMLPTCSIGTAQDKVRGSIRALTPADAQAALDKLLEEARLEGWRAGRDAAAQEAEDWFYDPQADEVTDYRLSLNIRMMPEPQEASPAGRSEADARRRYAVQLLHQAVDLAMSQAEGRA